MKTEMGKIIVNGEMRECLLPCTVADLLKELDLKPTQVVVERNGEALPKARMASVLLHHGDSVEIILPVAGG